MKTNTIRRALLCAGLIAPAFAFATDGYFAHSYGLKALGMGGAGVAVALEPYGGAVNPAAMTSVGDVWDVGLYWFSPDRSASRTGSGMANIDGSVTSGSTNFFVPEFGMNKMIRPDVAVGISVYGNGGMNTDYSGGQVSQMSACASFNPTAGPYNLLCGNGRLGVDLSQLMIAPYVAWKFAPGNSIGIAPVIAYQRFSAEGLQAFDNPMLSTSPGNVTNRGYDNAWGYGARIGYYGEFDMVSVGIAYATKMNMDNFDKYKGLFAEGGSFDIPSNWTVGFGFRPTKEWLVAVDFERIFYSDSPAVSNRSAQILNCFGGQSSACLGGSSGAGFGWQDIDVWKIGVQYTLDERWTLRAGYNHTDNPIQPQDVTFNILAPGVIKDHYTAGATWKLDKTSEITGYFLYAAENSVSGQSLLVPLGAPPSTSETIKMKEYAFGLGYTARF
jgi:long-chain fatty acid transport protein